jgi:hypothetical protein
LDQIYVERYFLKFISNRHFLFAIDFNFGRNLLIILAFCVESKN